MNKTERKSSKSIFEEPKPEFSITVRREKDNPNRFHLAVNGVEVLIGTRAEVFAILRNEEKIQKIIKECKK